MFGEVFARETCLPCSARHRLASSSVSTESAIRVGSPSTTKSLIGRVTSLIWTSSSFTTTLVQATATLRSSIIFFKKGTDKPSSSCFLSADCWSAVRNCWPSNAAASSPLTVNRKSTLPSCSPSRRPFCFPGLLNICLISCRLDTARVHEQDTCPRTAMFRGARRDG